MNLKNKILLTALALLLSICIFNTDCFAFEVSVDIPEGDSGTLNIPDVVKDYYYLFYVFDKYPYTDSHQYMYYLIVASEPISYTSNCPNSSKPFGFYSDGNFLGYIAIGGSIDAVQNELDNFKLYSNPNEAVRYFLTDNYNLFVDATPISFTSNHDFSNHDDNSIIFTANDGKIERGTDEGGTTDNTIGGTESDSENTTDSDDSGGILSSITQGFKNVVDFFKELLGFVGNILSYLNPFSENFILKGVLDFLGEILSYINPFSDNFLLDGLFTFLNNFFTSLFNFIGNIISYLNPFDENFLGYKLIELLQNLFEFLFIPNENSFTGIIDIVKSKFDFIDTIKTSANSLKDLISNVGTAPKLSINVNSNKYGVNQVTLIDLEWYKPYKTYGDLVLTGFIYAFFLWRLFISIPNILHGFGGSVQDSYKITEIKGGKD